MQAERAKPSSTEQFMRGTPVADAADADVQVVVLRRNLRTVRVYQRCQLTRVGMSAACLGVSATECRAALETAGVPRKHWARISAELQMMGRAAAQYINDEAEAARHRK